MSAAQSVLNQVRENATIMTCVDVSVYTFCQNLICESVNIATGQDVSLLEVAGFGSSSSNVGSYLEKKRKVPASQRIRYVASLIFGLIRTNTLG